MDDKANMKLDVQAKIKSESQDDEVVTSEMNNSDLNTSTGGKKKVKNEPLEELASCSLIRITNSFSVPTVSNGAPAPGTSSTSNNSNNCNDSIASLSNNVVKTESVFIKTESSDKVNADSNAELNRVEIKKEPGTDNASNNSREPRIPHDNVKKENTTNVIKKENETSTVNQNNNSNGIGALPNSTPVVSPQDPSIVIANILTSSIPSASVSNSSSNGYRTNYVPSSTDGKPVCRYGMSCYRLSALHRVNFHHPPGSDPLKSPEKPKCRYGTRCYRKNEEHRRRFIHDRSPDNGMSNTRRRKVKNAASQTTSVQYDSDSDDSYLYEDYDGSSDEFHPDPDDDTDSDETDFEPDADDSLLAA